MKKWFAAQKQQTKILLWYLIFALLPMILITIYTYFYTSRLMLDSLNKNLDSQIEQIAWDLDDTTGDYYTISNLLYMDETLWSYLMADYSERGYEDLYLYVDELFSNIRMLYPEISGLSVLSTNATLPRDNYYFYVMDKEELESENRRLTQAGNVLQMYRMKDGGLCFIRFMNRYETGKNRNFLMIRIDSDVISQILDSGDDTLTVLLEDDDGVIQVSNQEALTGRRFETLELKNQVVREQETDYSGRLILYTDSRIFKGPVRRAALQIFLLFSVSSGLAFIAIARYSFHFQKNVEKVLNGANQISYGDFSYKIPDVGTDEIGVIAEAVNTLGERIRTTIAESYEKELKRQISERNQLQEQINPHFLYNALSSISSMALNNGDPETSQAIVYLADFYRISLNQGKQELTIREELRLLESYMKIQQVRFGNSIELEYDLDEGLLEHKVMKLTLQPIVENSIHHGRTDDSESFHILIRLYGEEGKTVLEVIDDGRGIPPEKMLELQDSMDQSVGGYGLRNVSLRIKLQYGPEYGISMESEEGFGTKVRIKLP
ncbi:MAG TPA: sensor histidine kinase [Candidatus Eisenbergiella merdavium]|uniref:histidine kinase n=1 Tax=Candidatus Eisenbergiella merdavium TaxID=2838551 RepID=A0A9D2NCN1_9FIRM|nr:sensor histidine kinase [Candidatus Eisenbergiella merdavium]